nr:MAG TPA: hypothetical protein [Inoviridae sp.]
MLWLQLRFLFLQVLLRLKALQVVLIMQVRQWMLC